VLIGRLLSTSVDERTDPAQNHNIKRIKRSAFGATRHAERGGREKLNVQSSPQESRATRGGHGCNGLPCSRGISTLEPQMLSVIAATAQGHYHQCHRTRSKICQGTWPSVQLAKWGLRNWWTRSAIPTRVSLAVASAYAKKPRRIHNVRRRAHRFRRR
jgi:hypothetical protein